MNALQNSSSPLYQRINDGLDHFARSDPSVLAADEEIHFQKVLKEKYVFIAFLDLLHWEHRDCRLVKGENSMMQAMSAPVFMNGSALTGFFSHM